MVCAFHAVCTRHPETIQASGSANRNNASAIAALTGLRSAAARKSSVVMVGRAFGFGSGSHECFPSSFEERSDEAIQLSLLSLDCFASLAMTEEPTLRHRT